MGDFLQLNSTLVVGNKKNVSSTMVEMKTLPVYINEVTLIDGAKIL